MPTTKIKKQILGMSNSSALFVPAWKDPKYLRLLIELSGKPNPVISYIGAANGANSQRLADFYELSKRVQFTPQILDLYNMHTDDENEYFKNVDIVYIDGGSTRNLMALIYEWKLDRALRHAYENGVLLVGASAGINILFEANMTDSIITEIRPSNGLGLLKGSICPHYNARAERQTVFKKYLESDEAQFPAYAIEDDVTLHMINDELHQVYSIDENASLFVCADNSKKFQGQTITLL